MNIEAAKINTAGAFLYVDGFYLFALGIRPHNGQIPIVRLGGHREEHETGWQCAVREVYEEAGLRIQPLQPQRTYLSNGDHAENDLQEIQWNAGIHQEPDPILVVTYCRQETILLSLMYLAHAETLPTPSSEVKGLILLTKEQVHLLCQSSLTLEQFLGQGGKAILSADFDLRLPLEPFLQLRLLSRILSIQPE
jgi:hypothetical protein